MNDFSRAIVARPKALVRSIPLALLFSVAALLSVVSTAWGLGELTQNAGQLGCVSLSSADGCRPGRAIDGAIDVAISPDGRNAYVASFGSDAIAIFDRDPATGALTQKPGAEGCISNGGIGGCRGARALDGPTGIAVTPDGRTAYVTAQGSDAVAVFDRDQGSGGLSQSGELGGCVAQGGAGGCRPATGLDGPSAVAISPDGRSAYVTSFISDAVAVFARDAAGDLTQLPGIDGCHSNDGTGGACRDGLALDNAVDVAVSPDGTSVYVTALLSDAIAIFNRAGATGALTQKPGMDGCISNGGTGVTCRAAVLLGAPNSMAISPDGRNIYVGTNGARAITLNRDPAGGLTQPVFQPCLSADGDSGVCGRVRGIDGASDVTVSPDGRDVYVSGLRSLLSFDRDPFGTLTQKAGRAGCVSRDGSGGFCGFGRGLVGIEGGLTVSRDGRNVYLTAGETDAIAIFSRATPAPPPPPPPGDGVAPTVSAFRLAPSRFQPQPAGSSSFRFTLSETATAQIEIDRGRPGRRTGGRCMVLTPALAERPLCRRWVERANLGVPGLPAGPNAIRFSGRVSGRALNPGAFLATIVATDAAGNRSAPLRAAFEVLASPQRR